MNQSSEIWKAVPGFEGSYEVSDLGRVRSLSRVITAKNASIRGYPRQVKGKILRAQDHSAGYAQVALSGKCCLVSHLVLLAFVGLRPEGAEACHNSGRKRDDRLVNLRYDRHVANCADRVIHGTHSRGERNGNAILKKEDVLYIRRSMMSRQVLAYHYGVRAAHIDRIRAKERWQHV